MTKGDSASELVAAAILVRNGEVLLSRRPEGKHLAGLWEFPGGKVEPGETPEQALVREIREELGIELGGCRPFGSVRHAYPEKTVHLLVFWCAIEQEPVEAAVAWRWQPIRDLDPSSMPEADRSLVESLREAGLR